MAEMSSLGTESFNAPAIVPFKPMTPVMASPGMGATGSMENTSGEGLSIMESMKESLSGCLLYTSPSPRDTNPSRMPSSA